MKQNRPLALALTFLCLALCLTTFTSAQDNGCALRFTGSDRKAVKLRRTNLDYTFHNGGRAVTVADFFAFVCPLDAQVPSRRADIPKTEAMEQERVKIKVRAFVLAMKKDPDNDLHIQIADKAKPYEQQQLIVEIPPGEEFCEVRSMMMGLFRADGGGSLSKHIFKKPPQVDVTGYLFLDAAHITGRRSDFCTNNGGRGIKSPKTGRSSVRGIWEVHPVISLKKV
jgi:hypothetical protein